MNDKIKLEIRSLEDNGAGDLELLSMWLRKFDVMNELSGETTTSIREVSSGGVPALIVFVSLFELSSITHALSEWLRSIDGRVEVEINGDVIRIDRETGTTELLHFVEKQLDEKEKYVSSGRDSSIISGRHSKVKF